MPAKSEGPKGPNMEEHPLVSALVPDPAQGPPNATVLQGLAGKSPTPGVWRLYLNTDLSEYVEIPESEILHTQQLPDNGGTLVWVPKGLTLNHVQVAATQMQAEFLSGSIATAALGRAAGQQTLFGVAGQPLLRQSRFCGVSDVIDCPSDNCPFPSEVLSKCPSRAFPCPSTGCPTVQGPGCGWASRVCAVGTEAQAPIPTPPIRPTIWWACNPTVVNCPSVRWWHCPSWPVMCLPSVPAVKCPTQPIMCMPSVAIPCQSVEFCPSFVGCPSGPVCGGIPGNPGDPVAG